VVTQVQITGTTKLLGVMGNPVAHSLSPLMHNAALASLSLDYCYLPLEIRPELLPQAVVGLKALGCQGFNVTIPYKEQIVASLDEVDDEALIIGAVNTVVNREGKLVGYNTDGRGFLRSLAEEWDLGLRGEQVVVLGAGGAARAIVAGLASAGASKITIANRNVERGLLLKADLEQHYPCKIAVVDLSEGELDKELAASLLVVQTTPVGMYPHVGDTPIIEPSRLWKDSYVYDIIFNPPETRFLLGAREQGCRTANGLGMLLHQGALSFEYWTGIEAPVKLMRQALLGR
jgi:shikimate dehydrogenase